MSRFRAMPYARALLDVVSEQCPERAEEVAEELQRLAEALAAVPELQRVLVTPMVTLETKTGILEEVLSQLAIGDPTRRFAHVVQRHYRLQHAAHVAATYRELLDRKLGRVRARVEVVGGVSADQRQRLLEVVSELANASVVADFVDNPDLLGGFRVQVGSKVFDASLLGQLEQLSRQVRFE